ncbi:hypothetical protein [Ignavibacterium album]|uniref:hypothetical protein n=1 Tax=Ignavibacterium album TaxID=591197 RepID=UPI0035B82E05
MRLFLIIFIFCVANLYSSQLMLGISYKTKVTIWRYWENVNEQPQEKILVFNEDTISTNISIWLAKVVTNGLQPTAVIDSSYGVLGRWNLSPHKFIIKETFNIEVDNPNFYVLAVYKNDTTRCGYLPIYTPKPFAINNSDKLFTTQGINGIGGNCNFCQWEHKSLFLKSGQKEKIILRLSKQAKPVCSDSLSVLFFEITDSKYDNLLKSVNTNSENLIIDSTSSPEFPFKWLLVKNINGKSFTVPKENSMNEFIIITEIRAPTIDYPKMMYYSVNTYSACGGGSFHLPIIVLPE